jgi:hypothetical protein
MENLGIFYDHLVYFTAIEKIIGRMVYFVVIWCIFPRFGVLYQEKSGNPGPIQEHTKLTKKWFLDEHCLFAGE